MIDEIHLIVVCVFPDQVYLPGALCLCFLQRITDHCYYVVQRDVVLDECLQVKDDVPRIRVVSQHGP